MGAECLRGSAATTIREGRSDENQSVHAGAGGLAALAFGVAACGSDNSSSSGSAARRARLGAQLGGSLNGAGATFPQPVYQEWAARFQKKAGTTVNYQGIGSGGGVAQFTAGTVDFGASDSPMTDEEITAAQKKGDPVHVPTVLGAVTVSYNLSGVEVRAQARRRRRIADIFLGKIKQVERPEDRGPELRRHACRMPTITICHRSDESGTTKNFTAFLAAYSDEWKNGPGVDKSVKWPSGTGAKGNDGVAACIKQNADAVGYVEQAYALANNFTFASVKNKSGDYIAPTLESTSAAAVGLADPGRPADLDDRRAGQDGVSDHRADVPARLRRPVQGRQGRGQGQAI